MSLTLMAVTLLVSLTDVADVVDADDRDDACVIDWCHRCR